MHTRIERRLAARQIDHTLHRAEDGVLAIRMLSDALERAGNEDASTEIIHGIKQSAEDLLECVDILKEHYDAVLCNEFAPGYPGLDRADLKKERW